MPSLEIIQESLVKSIFGDKGKIDFIKANGSIKAEQRLAVHQDTIFENFVTALEITYPGVWRLIGHDCARGLALAYGHEFANITDRANISGFGESFPDFLENFPSTKHLDYLPDYAKIEWLRSRSYQVINQKVISAEQFNEFMLSDPESVIFEFNDSVFFLRSRWPLAKIQRLLDEPDSEKIDMNYEECFILICRVHGRIENLFLEKEQWQFLSTLKNGVALGQAFEQIGSGDDVDTKISMIIRLLFIKEMIVKLTV